MNSQLLSWVLLLGTILVINGQNPNLSDISLDTCQMVQARGLNCEPYVVTSDGYIITMHRIPPVSGSPTAGKYPAILQHGLIGNSATWVMGSANVTLDPSVMGVNLGIELAKRGYDVYLANSRGNKYAVSHTTLNANAQPGPFWDFTHDELALVDLPSFIDAVIGSTGKSKVHYVGHSQGGAIAFALLSTNTAYNSKLASVNTIGPALYMQLATSTMRATTAALTPGLQLLDGGKVGLFTQNIVIESVPYACPLPVIKEVCNGILYSITGVNPIEINYDRIAVYVANYPDGTSGKNFLKFNQMYNTNLFQRYDYGNILSNYAAYGSFTPPKYDISKITYPSSKFLVIYALNDALIPIVNGINRIKAQLPNLNYYQLSNPFANHLDPLLSDISAPEANYKVLANLEANNN